MSETKIEFKDFSTDLKDHLCRVYNYIVTQSVNVDNSYHKRINFTKEGILFSLRNLSMIGWDKTDDKFADRFLSDLDLVKKLFEAQPFKEVEYFFSSVDGEGKDIVIRRTKTFKTYDLEDMERSIERDKHSVERIKTISTNC